MSANEHTATKGTPSPRWAVWARFLIRCKSGEPYLARLRLIQTPLFGVYLHDIFEPDDGDPHNHPWSFVSIVLRGAYTEYVYLDPLGEPRRLVSKRHGRWSAHAMGRKAAHRIVAADPKLKTLILTGPRSSSGWGFFEPRPLSSGGGRRYVPWQEYGGSR